MSIILNMLLLAVGLFLLIKGSDIFVDAGTIIGKMFKMTEVLIGLTIVCVGTGLPELILSINGSIDGTSNLVIGNIVGTNIFNMCIILGLICVLHPLKLLRQTIRKDMHMSLLSSVVLFVLLLDNIQYSFAKNTLSLTDGIILLLLFGVFIYYTFYEITEYLRDRREKKYQELKEKKNSQSTANQPEQKEAPTTYTNKDMKKLFKNIAIALIGVVMVHIGAEITVDSTVKIAEFFNVSQTFISIVIIAVGTSLPELTTSYAAIKKNRINIAIGNLIGSNMFNTLCVLGVSALINPIVLEGNYLLIDCAVFILVCTVMVLFTKRKPEISKFEGFSLISIYILYIVYVLFRR
ncbi:MAG: calcium/sodium antiporter [Clostridia bacterium]|nr:calcium/sodium antiporter [Clostridia bacterium]